ncbi:hypothetical protein [Hymenobacter rubidus]|uniref:hypothetical protein n=1 Tax=Hymenobacter rubidus TaxID=1441626 RepID=UPI00191E7284|nr:hypothetical protein [Hymenobacter rubidus]
MAGERLATQRVFIHAANMQVGSWVELWLGTAYRRFTAISENSTPTPSEFGLRTLLSSTDADQAQTNTVQAFAYAVQQRLGQIGIAGDYTVTVAYGTGLAAGVAQACVVQAVVYDPFWDFRLPSSDQVYLNGNTGFSWYATPEDTIRPVRVAETHTPTGAFGTATGAIALVASNGTVGTYAYRWADAGAPLTASRTGLAAGSYSCTVTDASGASTTVVVAITEDPRLDVLVSRTDNNVTLVPSGGLAPYAYQWTDGPTTATRLGLPVGTYACTVTDARGASQAITFTVDPYRFYWSKNPVTLALDAGDAYRLDPSTKPQLSFVCEVWVEEVYRSNVFTRIGPVQEQPADRDGRTVFDAQALLDDYLTEHLPALNQARPSRADSLFRRFYFKYAEKYGTPAVAAALSSQAQHYVVLGGLDFFAAPAGTWFDYQARVQPFLTWEPDNKAVRADQPEYLYFMADSFALTDFQVQVRLLYADGTAGQLTAFTVPGVHRFEVYCLPVGYRALGLGGSGLSAGPAVVGWQVWVSDAAGVAQTERRTYALATDYVARPRYFLYTNSLGGVSTLASTGDAKTALDVQVEETERALPAGYDPLLGDTLPTDRSGVLTLSVSSGDLRRDQLVAAQDLLLSLRVTLQAQDAYFPGRVKAKSLPLVDEAPGELNRLEFDFLLPRQRRFTPRLPASAAGRPIAPVRGGGGAQP